MALNKNIFCVTNPAHMSDALWRVMCDSGVDVADISSKTMESKLCPGLFWVGEVMDISGDLGGFNLQWAWSSGVVAGKNA